MNPFANTKKLKSKNIDFFAIYLPMNRLQTVARHTFQSIYEGVYPYVTNHPQNIPIYTKGSICLCLGFLGLVKAEIDRKVTHIASITAQLFLCPFVVENALKGIISPSNDKIKPYKYWFYGLFSNIVKVLVKVMSSQRQFANRTNL